MSHSEWSSITAVFADSSLYDELRYSQFKEKGKNRPKWIIAGMKNIPSRTTSMGKPGVAPMVSATTDVTNEVLHHQLESL